MATATPPTAHALAVSTHAAVPHPPPLLIPFSARADAVATTGAAVASPSPMAKVPCPACDVGFGEDDARLLPCGHTLCVGCIEALVAVDAGCGKEEGAFVCIVCQCAVSMERVVVNHVVVLGGAYVKRSSAYSIDIRKEAAGVGVDGGDGASSSNNGLLCELCLADALEEEAVSTCVTCVDGKPLCVGHAPLHRKRNSSHELTPLSNKQQQKHASLHCPSHPDLPAILFCQRHKAVICSSCAFLHHCDHGEEVIDATEAAHMLNQELSPLVERLSAGAVAMEAAAEGVKAGKAALVRCVEERVTAFERVIEDVKRAVDEYGVSVIASMRALCGERVKLLDGQVDELIVSAGQLRAGVLGCERVMCSRSGGGSGGDVTMLCRALDGAKGMLALCEGLGEKAELRASVKLDVICDGLGGVLSSLRDLARMEGYVVDVGLSEVVGEGVGAFVVSEGGEGEEVENVFRVVCRSKYGGGAAGWVREEDVVVDVKGEGGDVGGDVRMCVSMVDAGVAEVRYVVRGDDNGVLKMSVRVCGKRLMGGVEGCDVWEVKKKPFVRGMLKWTPEGRHVRTIKLKAESARSFGLTLSHDGNRMAVADCSNDNITVYDVASGHEVRTFGSKGSGPMQFYHSGRLCTSGADTILVADQGNKRIQEVTWEGEHVRFIGDPGAFGDAYPWSIACHGDVMAVGKTGTCLADRVVLYYYSSGEMIRTIFPRTASDGLRTHVGGLRFSADGKHVLIADSGSGGRVSQYDVEGELVKRVSEGVLGEGNNDLSLTMGGNVVVVECSKHGVCVRRTADGSEVKRWGSQGSDDGQFQAPACLAVSPDGRQLYVLDSESARVQVFE